MNDAHNDIAGKIIRGEEVDVAAALVEEAKQRHRREQDAVRLQLLCARIAKAIGRNVEQRTLMGALAVMTAQAIVHVHPSRHGKLYVDYLLALKIAIEGTYPKGQTLDPPDMSVLDTKGLSARVEPAAPPMHNDPGDLKADTAPQPKNFDVVGHAPTPVPKPLTFKEIPWAGESPPHIPADYPAQHDYVAGPIEPAKLADDLQIPGFLRRKTDASQG